MYDSVCEGVCVYVYGAQRITLWIQFFLSIFVCVLGTKLRSSGLHSKGLY